MDPLGLLGGGKIGEALLSGLLRGEREPADIVVCEKHPERARYLADTYGVKALDVAGTAAAARTLVLAVKPQDIEALLAELAPVVTTDHLIVSVCAGVTTSKINSRLPDGVPVVRCMPNTPALVDEAMTAVSAGAHAEARTSRPPRRCWARWAGSCGCRSRSSTRSPRCPGRGLRTSSTSSRR